VALGAIDWAGHDSNSAASAVAEVDETKKKIVPKA
jgi:hypothetical protein